MIKISLFKSFIFCLLCGVALSSAAHRYFFGLTDLSVNPRTHNIEVIHQLTAHDIENAIAEQQQIHFSPEHAAYEQMIQNYVEAHFKLIDVQDNKYHEIKLNWIGLEITKGNVYIYQEANFEKFLSGLVVKNDLLVDTYVQQINTVNYKDETIIGSLTFSKSVKTAKIAIIKNNN
ncbi:MULTISPECIES: DUF6702 family protein [unclassified Colwellia]|uniref:DUF6702 family protein n=1 Tax=unclassified Colwellia TaxID=196834 RepID=UPI0015F59E26|nr:MULTISPECIES: DUF6702 family protein [unclassified Colwellia]MBA6232353.1 hypothetical protein [Colwellia sp. MB02u-7]MBA6236029.1 hypothetical protein [Colwellia sp. MB02u-11]MBA6256717.1 hypothetical protein [Colwellia sp. MB3u-28]MBA6261432.1 hypothetical protein [Colwellia sp. MB3u-41]MBA6298566.1 hypothetical protein [Colwellia sp. MB3u-22]